MNTAMVVAPTATLTTCAVLQLTESAFAAWPLAVVLVVLSLVIPVLQAKLEVWKRDRFAALTPAQRRDVIELERAKNTAGGTS